MTDPAQSEVIALRAQVAKLEADLSKAKAEHGKTLLLLQKAAFETIPTLEATVTALRDALEAMLDSAHPHPVIHPMIHPTMTVAWFKARAALELAKEK
jgi:hypothetical protein